MQLVILMIRTYVFGNVRKDYDPSLSGNACPRNTNAYVNPLANLEHLLSLLATICAIDVLKPILMKRCNYSIVEKVKLAAFSGLATGLA